MEQNKAFATDKLEQNEHDARRVVQLSARPRTLGEVVFSLSQLVLRGALFLVKDLLLAEGEERFQRKGFACHWNGRVPQRVFGPKKIEA